MKGAKATLEANFAKLTDMANEIQPRLLKRGEQPAQLKLQHIKLQHMPPPNPWARCFLKHEARCVGALHAHGPAFYSPPPPRCARHLRRRRYARNGGERTRV